MREENMTEMVRYDAMVQAIVECHKVDDLKEIHNKALALELYARQAKNIDAERKAIEVRIRAERRVGQLLSEMKRTTPQEKGKQGGALRWDGAPKESTVQNHSSFPQGMNYDQNNPPPGHPPFKPIVKSEYALGIEAAGVSPKTAHNWQQLAKVPQDKFDAAISGTALQRPSSAQILRDHKLDASTDPLARLYSTKIIEQDDGTVVEVEVKPPRVLPGMLDLWGRLREMERITTGQSASRLADSATESMLDDLRRITPALIDWLQSLEEVLHVKQ
jgi:hypothetical protein